MNREQAINWLKNAQKRQQEWQQEVKRRWAERLPLGRICNPTAVNISI